MMADIEAVLIAISPLDGFEPLLDSSEPVWDRFGPVLNRF